MYKFILSFILLVNAQCRIKNHIYTNCDTYRERIPKRVQGEYKLYNLPISH